MLEWIRGFLAGMQAMGCTYMSYHAKDVWELYERRGTEISAEFESAFNAAVHQWNQTNYYDKPCTLTCDYKE